MSRGGCRDVKIAEPRTPRALIVDNEPEVFWDGDGDSGWWSTAESTVAWVGATRRL
jgi:hypothetical protein